MIKKYYVTELTNNDDAKQLVGSILVGIWFWQSPLRAFRQARINASEYSLINFRRIK